MPSSEFSRDFPEISLGEYDPESLASIGSAATTIALDLEAISDELNSSLEVDGSYSLRPDAREALPGLLKALANLEAEASRLKSLLAVYPG